MDRHVGGNRISRRRFLKEAGLLTGGMLAGTIGCGQRAGRVAAPTASPTAAPLSTPVSVPPTATRVPPTVTPVPPTATRVPPTATPAPPRAIRTAQPSPTPASPRSRIITANDFVPEQVNYIDTILMNVNFADRRHKPFNLAEHLDKIFGTKDPIRQLNAFYSWNYYGQLQMRQVKIGPKGYMELQLPGTPKDYAFGFLIGESAEGVAQFDPDVAEKLTLEVMARAVEQYPDVAYQDRFVLMVLNALGVEYGRGAAGALPSAGVNPLYDMFIGDVASADRAKFSDPANFRLVGTNKVLGLIRHTGYTFDNYYRDRGQAAFKDQFILGIGVFSRDAPLSCASHDILHGLRRKSAYADPPQGRARAANCLYNVLLQNDWTVGTKEHGRQDRSINCSPYIGWWDSMGDHLHPVLPRGFFEGHPHGTCSYTKLAMGMIPQRCIAVAEKDDVTIRLAPLSNPKLPARGSDAEAMVVQVPILPGNPAAAHVYLLLEYRRRVEGGANPENFTISPDSVLGDKRWDPGYNSADPAKSRYINPPTTFVSKEGVLVYLVNEKLPSVPVVEYSPKEWFKFVVVLLNPAGHDKRSDLTQAALASGERMEIDLRHLYAGAAALPVKITVAVSTLSADHATVRISRELVR